MELAPSAASRPRTRVSPLRLAVVLVSVAAVVAVGYRAVHGVVVAAATPGPSTFSAYVDVTAWPTYAFETPAGPAQSDVTLAFVVADPDAACTPSWGGYYTLDGAASELDLDRRIAQLRSTGGQVRVSFGGQANDELASVCTDELSLRAAYAAVVERYDLTTIDLDLEGAALEDVDGVARRAQAVAAVQRDVVDADGALDVWLTLPVDGTGLTAVGQQAVAAMLAAGVDVTGVNGMTMDFGVVTTVADPLYPVVEKATVALHTQVVSLFADAGQRLDDVESWSKIGITSMIGQSDIATEQFTIADAVQVNQFARDHGVGLVSMWSLNRDSTCSSPLPSVTTVVQSTCSGIDQGGSSFAEVLSADLPAALPRATSTPTSTGSTSPSASPSTVAPTAAVDDPATSPYPIWDPLGTYPSGTKIVWHRQVYQARYWTSGVAPDTAVTNASDSPWTLLGPVLPGDTPSPLPTLPADSYPQWDATQAYVAGTRVQLGLVPYEAKWWTQGQEPGTSVAGGSPWVLVIPSD
ncbi:MAG: glycosyl hydrolase family 18 [Cellulomonas sp.]|nr:glycosyl hydrolase family 18 [Cellulomonas sp.]